MKRRITILVTVLLLGLLMGTTVFAWTDHGAVYTAVDAMDNDRLKALGEETIPALSQQLSFGLHADIVDDLEGYELTDYAGLFYNQYDYGVGENHDGALLMIYVTQENNQRVIQDYCIYGEGLGKDIILGDAGDTIIQVLDATFQSGPTSDQQAGKSCADAIEVFAAYMASFVQTQKGTADPESPATADPESPAMAEPENPATAEPAATQGTETPVSEAAGAPVQEQLVIDNAELLTDTQKLRLEDKAERISNQYGCNTYVLTVPTMDGAERRAFAKSYYTENQLGNGTYRNGILFMIAMDSRDYVTITYGRNPEDTSEYGVGILAFTDYGIARMEKDVVPYLSDGDYYTAFNTYLSACEDYLSYYAQGHAYDKGERLPGDPIFTPLRIILIICIPLLVALIVCLIFRAQMKTAVKATKAGAYLVDGSFQVTNSQDTFVRTYRSTRKIERDSGGSSSSGGSTVDSEGFGGSSGGKF